MYVYTVLACLDVNDAHTDAGLDDLLARVMQGSIVRAEACDSPARAIWWLAAAQSWSERTLIAAEYRSGVRLRTD